jgi:hypothetical protein
VVIPPLVGASPASLNLFVATVGGPGTGKGIASDPHSLRDAPCVAARRGDRRVGGCEQQAGQYGHSHVV